MRTPYIGITGFMSHGEVTEVFSAFPVQPEYSLMVGVLASQKTLQGRTNKWPNRYPKVEEISSIFPLNLRALNLIHYNTKELDTLYDQLVKMTELGGPHFDGFQLNIAWPEPDILHRYRQDFQLSTIVLQMGAKALAMVDHFPELLADRVTAEYRGLIDYVLIDPSGGLGKPFDPEDVGRYIKALKEKETGIGLGAAGGLSPGTIDLIRPLAANFPGISIDAEGRLRDSDDHMDLDVTKEYATGASGILIGALRRSLHCR